MNKLVFIPTLWDKHCAQRIRDVVGMPAACRWCAKNKVPIRLALSWLVIEA